MIEWLGHFFRATFKALGILVATTAIGSIALVTVCLTGIVAIVKTPLTAWELTRDATRKKRSGNYPERPHGPDS